MNTNELTIVNPAGLVDTTSKNPKLTALLKDYNKELQTAGLLYSKASEEAEAINRRKAVILATIERNALYKDDGHKNFSQFTKALGIDGANTNALKNVGLVYIDDNAPAELKELTPHKLQAVLGAYNRNPETVKADAVNGVLADKTQDDLRAYANGVQADENHPMKATVAPRFELYRHGESDPIKVNGSILHTREEWENWLTSNGDELVKLPNGKVSADAKKATVQRVVVIGTSTCAVYKFRSETERNANGEVKTTHPKFTKDQLLAMLAAMESADKND